MNISLFPQKICFIRSFSLLFKPIASFLSTSDVEKIPLISAIALYDKAVTMCSLNFILQAKQCHFLYVSL